MSAAVREPVLRRQSARFPPDLYMFISAAVLLHACALHQDTCAETREQSKASKGDLEKEVQLQLKLASDNGEYILQVCCSWAIRCPSYCVEAQCIAPPGCSFVQLLEDRHLRLRY